MSIKLIEEICKSNPKLIYIMGNVNPTYSSDGISYCLVEINNSLYEFAGGYGQYVPDKDSYIDITRVEWLTQVYDYLKKYFNTNLIKHDNRYLFINYVIEEQDSEIYELAELFFVK